MVENENEPDAATREAESADATHAHAADRPPTTEEEAAAERSAESFGADRQAVAEHEEEMIDLGAHAKGEGAVE
jgi:hypothetical protein